jgi:hypothetical protein
MAKSFQYKLKTSTLDDLYVTDPTDIFNLLLSFSINEPKPSSKIEIKRNWRHYSNEKLIADLERIDWAIEADSVLPYWNTFENKISSSVDKIVPMTTFTDNSTTESVKPTGVKKQTKPEKKIAEAPEEQQ